MYTLIVEKLATLRELQEYYTLEEACELLSCLQADSYNNQVYNEYLSKQQR